MKIRAAEYPDIPAVRNMMDEGHARSAFADIPMHHKLANALLMQAIQRNGGKTNGATFFAVAEQPDGTIDAFIIGILQPFYQVLDILEATDLFWYASPQAHARSAMRLLVAMHRWARRSPHVGIIRHGNSDAITGRDRAGKLFERVGMKQTGNIYEKDLRHERLG